MNFASDEDWCSNCDRLSERHKTDRDLLQRAAEALKAVIQQECRYVGRCNSSRCPCRPYRATLSAIEARLKETA